MANFYLYFSFYYVAGLVLLSEALRPRIVPLLADQHRSAAVESIELSIERTWSGSFVINDTTKEIDVLSEEEVVISPTENRPPLEIAALRPGTYEMDVKEQDPNSRRVWTVHSVPSYTIRPNMFFEYKLDFSRVQIKNGTKTSSLKNIGVRADPQRGIPIIYGFADDIRDGTVLKIQINYANFSTYTIKVRLLLEEPLNSRKLCTNAKRPCLNNIKLWVENFDKTLQNEEKFSSCVATRFGKKASDLFGVSFQDYGSDMTLFEAQPIDIYVDKYLDYIIGQLEEKCSPKIIGYSLTSSSGLKKFKPLPDAVSSTTTEISPELTNMIDVDTVTDPSTTTEDVPKQKTVDAPPVVVTSTTTEDVLMSNSIDDHPMEAPSTTTTGTTENVLTSKTIDDHPMKAPTTTTENVLESTTIDDHPMKAPSTTTTESFSNSNVPDVYTAAVPEDLATSSSTESSTPTELASSDNPEASEVNRTRDTTKESYSSVAEHVLFFAICAVVVFFVLFVVVGCFSL